MVENTRTLSSKLFVGSQHGENEEYLGLYPRGHWHTQEQPCGIAGLLILTGIPYGDLKRIATHQGFIQVAHYLFVTIPALFADHWL